MNRFFQKPGIMAELFDEDALLTETRCGKQMEIFLEMLDYDYVAKCTCLDTLKSILKALKSGKYGRYPHLEKTVADKIISMLPEKEKNRIQVVRSFVPDDVINDEKGGLVAWMEGLSFEHDPVKHGNDSKRVTESEMKTYDINPVRGVTSALHGGSARVEPSPLQNEVTKQPTQVKKTSGLIRKEKLSTKEYFDAWAKFECDDSSDDEDSGIKDAVRTDTTSKMDQQKEGSRRDGEISRLQQHLQNNDYSPLERRTMSENERIKGNDYYRAGEMEESITCYTKSIMLNPVNAKVYANRAQARIRINELDLALQDCTDAIKLNPAYTKALARRGMILQKKERYAEAISDFSECCRLEPASVYERFLERCKKKHDEEVTRKKTTTTLNIVEVDGTEGDGENVDGEELDCIEEVYTPGALRTKPEKEYESNKSKVFDFKNKITSKELSIANKIESSVSGDIQIETTEASNKSLSTSPTKKINIEEVSEDCDEFNESLMMRIKIVMDDDDDDTTETTAPIKEDENSHLDCPRKTGEAGTPNKEIALDIVHDDETRRLEIKAKKKNRDATALFF